MMPECKEAEAARSSYESLGHYLLARRRFLAVALSGIFCLLAVEQYLWYAYGPGSWGCRFACKERAFDCGIVSANQMVHHDFVIGNSGRQPLHILDVKRDCAKCMTVKVSKKEIAPGESAVVAVVLDVSKLRKQGEFEKKMQLELDDADLPYVVLAVHGKLN